MWVEKAWHDVLGLVTVNDLTAPASEYLWSFEREEHIGEL